MACSELLILSTDSEASKSHSNSQPCFFRLRPIINSEQSLAEKDGSNPRREVKEIMNNQSNNQQNQNLKNAQAAQAKFNMESGSDLAQSQGTISRTLLAKSKSGFEFGSFGTNRAGANQTGANQAGANQYQPRNSQYEFGNLGTNQAGANQTGANQYQPQSSQYEFGNLGSNRVGASQSQPQSSQLDIQRSTGQISRILEKESR